MEEARAPLHIVFFKIVDRMAKIGLNWLSIQYSPKVRSNFEQIIREEMTDDFSIIADAAIGNIEGKYRLPSCENIEALRAAKTMLVEQKLSHNDFSDIGTTAEYRCARTFLLERIFNFAHAELWHGIERLQREQLTIGKIEMADQRTELDFGFDDSGNIRIGRIEGIPIAQFCSMVTQIFVNLSEKLNLKQLRLPESAKDDQFQQGESRLAGMFLF